MANLHSGLRRVPHSGLWIWFALIQGLINLLCVPAKCLGVDNISVTVYPQLLNIKYGDPLEIICVDETSSSSDLYFKVNDDIIPSEIVNSTTRRLYIEKPEKSLTTYFCHSKKNVKNNCLSRVLVDSPPANVTDFACQSHNLERLNCSWTTPIGGQSVVNYSLTFLIYGNPVQQCNVVSNLNKSHYCIWDTDSQPRYSQMEKEYLFYLTSYNVFGNISQFFTIDHFSIVKPDPPTDLVSLKNNTHSVLLQWKIHKNMRLTDGVYHRIEYQIAKIDNITYFRSVDASSLPAKNGTYRFLLSNLPYAHMQYGVRIYIKCKSLTNAGIWSEYAFQFIYTASEKPKRPPDTIVGAFRQELFKTKRMIYIYWKQLEEYEQAGTNFNYNVSCSYMASPDKKTYHTITADVNKSLSYVIFENAPFDAIDVSIWSMNGDGSSINSSYLYIPPEADTRHKVTSFTKLAYINGTYKLLWGGVKNIDNYTIFWCFHNTTGICTGQMDFTVVNPNRTTYTIELPKENRYQFAISANSGKKTSGMVWAVCEIFEDSIQLYRFPIQMGHDAPGPTYVNIKWKMDCTPQEGAISGYQISYCIVLNTSTDCVTKNLTTIYITDPNQMAKHITNLEPYTTYSFTLAMNTPSGLKTLDNASTRVTTTEGTPSSPVNITVSDIQYNSLNISWDPPIHKNGIIGKYVIKNYGNEIHSDNVFDDKNVNRRNVKLTGLTGYTNYSLTVQACNTAIRSCSKINPNDTIFVRTRIGPPGKLQSPTVKSRPDIVSWEAPLIPGGIIYYYQLKRVKDGTADSQIFNTTNVSFSLVHCDGGVGETYSVRAVYCDEDEHYGAWTNRTEVELPHRNKPNLLEHPGEWSDTSAVACGGKDGLLMTFILMAVFAIMGLMYCSIKCYKKYRKMEDIKPVLPNGLGVPEKDISKYPFGGWNPSNKDEKPSSDEMLLLPNSRTTVSTTELKQKENDNCASSDHTDSTALSDTSRAPADRQISTSGDSSDSSLHLEVEASRAQDKNSNQDYEDLSSSDTEVSQDPSPYFSEQGLKKNSASGYVQQPVNPVSEYIQSAPMIVRSPAANSTVQNPSSSYVMASLSTPIFTTGVPQPSAADHATVSSGYVCPEDAQMKVGLNFPKLGPSPTKMFGPESLPTMPTLPSLAKLGADSSYIQLQSLDTLPSHKQPVHNTVPLKSQASSGYVSPGDAVINKHFNNMLSGCQVAEETAILDPTMSPDAYCRFSWSTDPANDNLHSLLADSPRINSANK